MESLRIEAELERQKSGGRSGNRSTGSENRDSGVADVEVCPCPYQAEQNVNKLQQDQHLKRSALSNSLLDMHEQCEYFGFIRIYDKSKTLMFMYAEAIKFCKTNY